LARRAHCPASVPAQIAQAVIPSRLPSHRGVELRRVALVVVGSSSSVKRLPINWFDMDAMRDAYDQVYVYTMGRAGFILQHVVDAYAAQTAGDGGKTMGVIFALVGLYLRVERQFSGSEVQKVHMQMARLKRQWPAIALPRDRGRMTAADVLAVPEGPARDLAIDEWCRSVWTAFRDNRQTIVDLLREYQIS
jgi:hypothetical protein